MMHKLWGSHRNHSDIQYSIYILLPLGQRLKVLCSTKFSNANKQLTKNRKQPKKATKVQTCLFSLFIDAFIDAYRYLTSNLKVENKILFTYLICICIYNLVLRQSYMMFAQNSTPSNRNILSFYNQLKIPPHIFGVHRNGAISTRILNNVHLTFHH